MNGLRIQLLRVPRLVFNSHRLKRFVSTTVNSEDLGFQETEDTAATGVIETSGRETLLYFNNVMPFDLLSQFRYFRFIKDSVGPRRSAELIQQHVMALVSSPANPVSGVSIKSVFPKDGGAFVKFEVAPEISVSEVKAKIQENIRAAPAPLFGLLPRPQAFPVTGTAWVEDLRRYPSSQLKVVFDGEDLSEESLYQLFRRYGPIVDIVPQAPESKEMPRYAIVKFKRLRSAVAAKNCANATVMGNTVVHIKYLRVMRENIMKDFVWNHPRISVPLLLTVMLALASVIFEPMREFFMREKLEKRFSLDNKYVRRVSEYMTRMRRVVGADHKRDLGPSHVWSERAEQVGELQLWMTENVNTFIVVRGPKGIGKQQLVMDNALRGRKKVLYLDCEALVKSRNDNEFLKSISRQIGYFPVFPWLNSLSTFIDLGVTGLTGQKSGLSESNDTQFKNILSLAAIAIRRSSLSLYNAYVKSTEDAAKRGTEDDYLQQHPEEKPVVVINKFASKSENYNFVYSALANWASMLISMNAAHVIFLVDDISPVPLLTEALPDQIFKQVVLSDASRESSRDYVMSQLQKMDDLQNIRDSPEQQLKQQPLYRASIIEKALEPIGGRMVDLQAFVRRVKSGESPQQAQIEMIKQTAEQIIQMNLISKQTDSDQFQFARSWELIKLIAKNESIPYSRIYTSSLFSSSPTTYLSQLEKSSLISLVKEKGIVKEIRASRPLFRSAFKNIVEDKKTFNVLETKYLSDLIAYESNNIKKHESEISLLGSAVGTDTIKARYDYLGNKITTSTNKIIAYEAQIKEILSEKKKSSKLSLGIF